MTLHGNQNSAVAMTTGFTPLFPTKTTRRLRYNDDVPISSTGGVMSAYIFSANGMFDPNITSTGHQPMGFDQMMLSYEHYHVYRCHWKVIFRNLGAYSGYCGVRIDADVGAMAVPTEVVENGRMTFGPTEPGGVLGWREFSGTVNIPQVQGMTRRNFLASEALRGSIASNPTEQTYIHCIIWNSGGQNMSLRVNVVLEYEAIFTELKPVSSSFARLKPPLPQGESAVRGDLQEIKEEREENDTSSLGGFETLSLCEPPQLSRAHPRDNCFGSPPLGGGTGCNCRS